MLPLPTRKIRSTFSALSFLFILGQSNEAFSQGLFAGAKGARAAGRAGAFAVKADDLMAAEYNPAGLSKLEATTFQLGNRFGYNMASFHRFATYEQVGVGPAGNPVPGGDFVTFDKVQNETPWQLLDPLFGVGSNFGTKNFGAALIAYAPPGAGRVKFPAPPLTGDNVENPNSKAGQRFMMIERNAQILVYGLGASYNIADVVRLGATFQWVAVPKIEYSLTVSPVAGLANEAASTSLDQISEIEAKDLFTPNLVLGAIVTPAKWLELGLSAQVIPTKIGAKGTIGVKAANSGNEATITRVDPNTGYAVPANDITLDIPLPMWFRLGARYVADKFDVELDAAYYTWSRVDALQMRSNGLQANQLAGTIPIDDVSVEKNWKNAFMLQLGGDYKVIDDTLTLRAGVGYESPVSDQAYQHVDFATGAHITAALGTSIFFHHFEVAMAYQMRRQFRVTVEPGEGKVYQVAPDNQCVPPYDVNSPFCALDGQPSPTVNEGIYNSANHFLSLDMFYRF